MKRRQTLKLVGAASVGASVSGCSGLLGGGCGPGDDEIGALTTELDPTETNATAAASPDADRESASITGEIQSVGDDVLVDDGTGTAELTTLFGDSTAENIVEGDCVRATGIPFAPDDSDADIRLLVEELGLADS